MIIYYALKIFPKMFIYINIGYASGIVILFNVFILITAYFLDILPGLYFHMIKIGKLKGIALVIHSNRSYLWSISNILFIIFQSLAPTGYTLVAPALYKSRQLFIKNISILFSWLSMIWPIFFHKSGKDSTTYIKILAILLSLYIVTPLSVFVFKLGVLLAIKATTIANSPLLRHLIQPVFLLNRQTACSSSTIFS